MTLAQLLLAHGVKLALVVALVGIFRHGLYRRCWSFVAYLLAILTCNTLGSFWQELLTVEFWIFKQALYDVLKMAIALELAHRVMCAFPWAKKSTRVGVLAVLLVTTAAVVAAPALGSYAQVFRWQPQVTAGAIWLFAATALAVLWYHLPLDYWHRAILMGFAPYLLIFTSLVHAVKRFGWDQLAWISEVDALAYLAVVGWWAFSAWRKAPAPGMSAEAMRRLQLERV